MRKWAATVEPESRFLKGCERTIVRTESIMNLLRIATCALIVAASGCGRHPATHEVAYVRSPSGKLEAIVAETNGGATASFGYTVAITSIRTKHSRQVAKLYGAVRSDSAYGVNVAWLTDDTLRIQFLSAKNVAQIANAVRVDGQEIQITVRSGVRDPTAPGGGMYYNLTRRP